MHILFLTDNFPPEVNAPASRTFEHCREWVKAGHEVTVITCNPNFPRGVVYDGYQNRLRASREVMDGIQVVRVWSYITANEGFVRRSLDYVSFMMSSLIASPSVKRVDLVIGTSPQFFTVCAAYFVSRFKRIPFIFELRDLWPESIKAVGAIRNKLILWLLELVELFLYRRASAVVAVTNAFKEKLIERGIDGKKIKVITNGVDLSRFAPCPRDKILTEELGLEGKFVVGYIGTHGMAHALETVLKAAKMLQVAGERDVAFLLLGDGARKSFLERMAEQEGIKNVRFVSSVEKAEVVRYWSVLDASIIHLKNEETFATVIPSKLFECMGMGLPVLHGVRGESADIVEEARIGLTFEPENSNQLCESILKLRDDASLRSEFKSNCTQEAGKYDRKVKACQMLKCIEDLKLGPSDSESRYTPFLRWVFGLGCLVLIILALLPPDHLPAVELHFSWGDKALHAAAFAGLCLIGSWAYLNRPYSIMLGLLVLGGGIEIAQFATGWRHMEFGDFVANAVGIMIGRIAFHLLRKKA
jgi:glycosyltransferase involved in cell wall biosynthesis